MCDRLARGSSLELEVELRHLFGRLQKRSALCVSAATEFKLFTVLKCCNPHEDKGHVNQNMSEKTKKRMSMSPSLAMRLVVESCLVAELKHGAVSCNTYLLRRVL